MRRLPTVLNLVVAGVLAPLLSPSLSLAGPDIPRKSELRDRVGQFYSAYSKQDWPKLFSMTAPFVRECTSVEEFRDGWTEDGVVLIKSWKIESIRHDSRFMKNAVEDDCTSKVYRPESGALVVTSQVDQDPDGEPGSGKLYLHWVLLDGVWYVAGPE